MHILASRPEHELCGQLLRIHDPSDPTAAGDADIDCLDLPALASDTGKVLRIRQWIGPQCLCHHLDMELDSKPAHLCGLALERDGAHGHAVPHEIMLLAQLRPHLSRAIELNGLLSGFAVHRHISMTMLNALPFGVLAVGADHRITFSSASANAIAADNDGLSIRDGYLAVARSSDARRFKQLVTEATRLDEAGAGRGGGWMRLARPSGRRAYAMLISPTSGEAAHDTFAGADCMVSIYDPERMLQPDMAGLQALYGLTGTEAALARRLAEGAALDRAAYDLGISRETARSHLKSTFRKVEVHRQQDLVMIMHSLALSSGINRSWNPPAPVRGPAAYAPSGATMSAGNAA
jgi:DNA-binding CsgD family transcriptional regulator